MDVVEGQEEALLTDAAAEQLEQPDTDRGLLRRLAVFLLARERDPKRAPLRSGESVDVVFKTFEQVTQRGEGERPFGGGRPRSQGSEAKLGRPLEARGPERGLADPSVALEQEPREPFGLVGEKGVEAVQLLLAADQCRLLHGAHLVEDATKRPS